MLSKHEEYILTLAQEMFPQLETAVVFMILSEHHFRIEDSLQSFTILSQTLEEDVNEINNQPPENVKEEIPRLDNHDVAVLPSSPVDCSVYSHIDTESTDLNQNSVLTRADDVLILSSKIPPNSVSSGVECSKNASYTPVKYSSDSSDDKTIVDAGFGVNYNSKPNLKKFCNVLSYIAVGKLNGARITFQGNGQRKPLSVCMFNSELNASTIFNPLEIQLSNTLKQAGGGINTGSGSKILHASSTKQPPLATRVTDIDEDIKPKLPSCKAKLIGENKLELGIAETSSVLALPIAANSTSTVFAFNNTPISSGDISYTNPPTITPACDFFPLLMSTDQALSTKMNSKAPSANKKTCQRFNSPSQSGLIREPAYSNMLVPIRQPRPRFTGHGTRWSSSPQRPYRPRPMNPYNRFVNVTSYSETSVGTSGRSSNTGNHNHVNHTTNHKLMYILRGVSGSGKSTLARQLSGNTGVVLSTDDFFIHRDFYQFDPHRLSEAHAWNQSSTEDYLRRGVSPVIIDNTNTMRHEMKPYMMLAMKYNYEICIKEPDTWWKFKANELARRTLHGVPKESIIRMLDRYEKNITVENIVGISVYEDYQQKLNHIYAGTENTARPTSMNIDQNTAAKSTTQNVGTSYQINTSTKSLSTCAESTRPCSSLTNLKPCSQTLQQPSSINYKNLEVTRAPDTVVKDKSLKSSLQPSSSRKKLAPVFKEARLLKDAYETESSWSNYLNILKDTNSPKEIIPETIIASTKHHSVETWTDSSDFTTLCKVNNNVSNDSDFKILEGNAFRFHSANLPESGVLPYEVNTFNKSTSTKDLPEKEYDASVDIATLQLLFPDLPVEHILDVYNRCDKELHWTTDVIAESSLFGLDENLNTGANDVNSYSTTLDAYYDTLCLENILQPSDVAERDITTDTDSGASHHSSTVQLKISKQFLCQLETLFGGEEKLFSTDDFEVDLNSEIAKNIYDTCKTTLIKQKKLEATKISNIEMTPSTSGSVTHLSDIFDSSASNDSKQLEEDEELARRLQEEEYEKSPMLQKQHNLQNEYKKSPKVKKKWQKSRSPRRFNETTPNDYSKWSVDRQVHRNNLEKIMAEEKAAHESEKRQTVKFDNMKLSSQMKREQLHNMFPALSHHILDEIFMQSGCNLQDTMETVTCIFSEEEQLLYSTINPELGDTSGNKPENFQKDNNRRWYFECWVSFLTFSYYEVIVVAPTRPKMIDTSKMIPEFVNDLDLSYADFRSEANLHRQQMRECQRKAAVAGHQMRGPLALYYRDKARMHQQQLREANQRAAKIICQKMNEGRASNELDLHGLHVDEAIDTLKSVINQKHNEPNKVRHLLVITGRGLNSMSGIPKIKNAVTEWLKSKNMKFNMVNDGLVKIFL